MTTQSRRSRLVGSPRTWTVVQWFGAAVIVATITGHLLGRYL